MRVCDALLFRRGLPLYPVPPAGQAPQGWEQWIAVGFALFAALAPLGLYRPDAPTAPSRGRASAAPRCAPAALCETYPDAIFCSLLGHRPPPKRTPWGLQQRIAALEHARASHDADGGLWHRTLDELDACAAAYAAYALAPGGGPWVGDAGGGRDRAPGRASCSTATTSCRRRPARCRPPSRPVGAA